MTATFYVGDAITMMNRLPEKSVDLVISSPPFLALRSYLPADHPDKALEGGSQSTPGEFIDWLLDVVEACERILAPHGSLCFELGDTYSGSGGGGGDYYEGGLREGQPGFTGSEAASRDALKAANAAHWRQKNPLKGKLAEYSDARGNPDGMRDTTFSGGNTRTGGGRGWPLAKSLSLIPESFRWAMVYGHNPFTGRQCDTWRLRNVIRWVRPNPPVGALGDKFRPATSELMVFCKAKDRFFDLDSVREPYKPHPGLARYLDGGYETGQGGSTKGAKAKDDEGTWQRTAKLTHAGAPPLDWWNIPPGGYPGAHYAVWPPELLIKPIKAMCSEKVCRVCGEPSRRIVETSYEGECTPRGNVIGGSGRGMSQKNAGNSGANRPYTGKGVGFSDCGHDDWRPGLVLDPFGGSGTTALVATGHGRDCILIDLDERNYVLALDRVGPFILSRAS